MDGEVSSPFGTDFAENLKGPSCPKNRYHI